MTAEWKNTVEIPGVHKINFCRLEIGGKKLLGYIETKNDQIYGLTIPLATSNNHMFMHGPSYYGSNEKTFADCVKSFAHFNATELDTNFDINKAYKQIGISESDRKKSQFVMSVSLSKGIGLFFKHPLTAQISKITDFVKILEQIPCKITAINNEELKNLASFSHSLSL